MPFCLANKAMAIQRAWSNPDDTLIWRPFQLGFLLSLESSVDDSHQDRG